MVVNFWREGQRTGRLKRSRLEFALGGSSQTADQTCNWRSSASACFLVSSANQIVSLRVSFVRFSLGSQDAAQDEDLLKLYSVTHILNMATGVQNYFPETFIYLKIDLLDLPTADLASQLPRCLRFIDDALRSDCTNRVLLHCNAGVSRSASVAIAYLMEQHRLTLSEAICRLKAVRPSIRPNDGFMQQLRNFERRLINSGSNDALVSFSTRL